MQNQELDYFRRRAEQEHARAAAGSDPLVASVHRTLAEMYEDRVKAGSGMRLRAVA